MSLATSATATVTAKTGADQAMVATVLTQVTELNINFAKGVVSVVWGSPSRTTIIEGTNLATITVTAAGVVTLST